MGDIGRTGSENGGCFVYRSCFASASFVDSSGCSCTCFDSLMASGGDVSSTHIYFALGWGTCTHGREVLVDLLQEARQH
jgi:hypothetical protein